ncbi:MAG: YihA family ribosome biogenesis GTP-binding protein [Deltaproteobacteria bacterium]|nr:MAG: YihA family ribosome biogenesis GTP-binding protein [Deltaproteobacteria bacterium]
MKIRSATFVKSGVRPADFPADDLPEVAFAGRSNVGKSSLMNCLMQRRNLVRVSNTPGRTQLLNWFNVNDQLLLCDLPGYGFARAPEHVRRNWGAMIETYLERRENLLAIAILVDVRRGFEDDDLQLLHAAGQFNLQPILVVTKCDKLSRNALFNRRHAIARDLGTDPDRDMVFFSSLSGDGRDLLWKRIAGLLPGVENT